jgi:DNA-binding NarL/FixJ family response regulator
VEKSSHSGLFRPLSPSKARVARCAADGLTYPQIALKLELSIYTVHHYMQTISELIEDRDLDGLPRYEKVQVWAKRSL